MHGQLLGMGVRVACSILDGLQEPVPNALVVAMKTLVQLKHTFWYAHKVPPFPSIGGPDSYCRCKGHSGSHSAI